MDLNALKTLLEEKGVVGAGGAGFPAFRKLAPADTIIVNCAECEPLLMLHQQLLAAEAEKIVRALQVVAEACGAANAVVALKHSYKDAIAAVQAAGGNVKELRSVYPTGDEVILIYEVTGRVVQPGAIPISQGIIVFNAETMYNIYCAVFEGSPVHEKLVTVTGEVVSPITLRVPLGTPLRELLQAAGGVTVSTPALLVGGPMMGSLQPDTSQVTKTTNAVIVLPADHPLVLRKKASISSELKRPLLPVASAGPVRSYVPDTSWGTPLNRTNSCALLPTGILGIQRSFSTPCSAPAAASVRHMPVLKVSVPVN